MARPADPLRVPAVADILKHLSAGIDYEQLRSKYPSVNRSTWSRWCDGAEEQFAAEGAGTTPRLEGPKKPPALPRAPPKTNRKPATKGQQFLPNVAGANGAARTRNDPKLSEDGMTYTVDGMFGPTESTVVFRYTDEPNMDWHDAMANLDRLGSAYLGACALEKACIKLVGDGHVITNTTAYAMALDQQHKIAVSMHKVMKDSRQLDGFRRFVVLLLENVKALDKSIAIQMINLIRESARQFVKTGE